MAATSRWPLPAPVRGRDLLFLWSKDELTCRAQHLPKTRAPLEPAGGVVSGPPQGAGAAGPGARPLGPPPPGRQGPGPPQHFFENHPEPDRHYRCRYRCHYGYSRSRRRSHCHHRGGVRFSPLPRSVTSAIVCYTSLSLLASRRWSTGRARNTEQPLNSAAKPKKRTISRARDVADTRLPGTLPACDYRDADQRGQRLSIPTSQKIRRQIKAWVPRLRRRAPDQRITSPDNSLQRLETNLCSLHASYQRPHFRPLLYATIGHTPALRHKPVIGDILCRRVRRHRQERRDSPVLLQRLE